jgi:hypothetical protein
MTTPNVYQLDNAAQGIHVSYSDGSGGAIAGLQIHIGGQTHNFGANDLTTLASDVGRLVSVVLRRTVDSGSTTFTLVVPAVNLHGPNQPITIHTYGITTLHRFSIIPQLNFGQTEVDTVFPLTGTANFVPF